VIGERGYRPPRPASVQRIVWPDDFGTRFTVFVDVEEEFDWRAPLDRRNRATTAMKAFPEAHHRFAERGVGLTCMVDHPIATDPASVAILSRVVEDGRSEIGTQLHAWVNPPFEAEAISGSSYAGNLPRALEAAKLEALTTAIATAFGVAPRAYRAGRYGIGSNSFELLAGLGYRIDSSVRPGYDYSADGGPDFTLVDSGAYRTGGIIELPLTTVFTGYARRGGGGLYRALGRIPKGRGAFARARLLSRIALTPEDMPIESALEAVAVAVGEGLRLLNLSFHSPSLVPGHTPYVRDAIDLKRFHAWWTTMLDEFDRRGIRNASLDEIIAALG
jgi:hypothetical protein